MATLNTPAGSRPNAQGMSQGTYTGDVNFSRGTTDLIASGAHLPSSPAGKPPTAAPKINTNPAPPPSAPRFLTGVTFNHNGDQARGF